MDVSLTNIFKLLFEWMPGPLAFVCGGVVSLFFIFTGLHLVRFILDLLPFL